MRSSIWLQNLCADQLVSCAQAQGPNGQEGYQLDFDRDSLSVISFGVGFPKRDYDVNYHLAFSNNVSSSSQDKPEVVPNDIDTAAVSMVLVRFLLYEVAEWIEGHDMFPVDIALALSTMSRVLWQSTSLWNDKINGSCPDISQDNFDYASYHISTADATDLKLTSMKELVMQSGGIELDCAVCQASGKKRACEE